MRANHVSTQMLRRIIQVRDHMHRAIQDYLCSERCEWMQKWPGMCVLNASQLHWTSETEELLVEQAGEAPQTMLTRQVCCGVDCRL